MLVLLVIQATQVLLLAVGVFLFFMVFGAVTMEQGIVAGWTGEKVLHLPGMGNVSVQLVQVSVFLAAFSGLYLTVSTVTDETYRGAVLRQRAGRDGARGRRPRRLPRPRDADPSDCTLTRR